MSYLLISIGILIILIFLFREVRHAFIRPMAAHIYLQRGRPDLAAILYEKILSHHSWLFERAKRRVRFSLAWAYMVQGEYERAADVCRAALLGKLKPADEADYRRRLGDCLDALGREDEADAEYHRAAECAGGAPDDAARWLVKGQLLDREHRYSEACDAYRLAVEKAPPGANEGRARAMTQLALASFNAGRAEDAARWGEAALEEKPSPGLEMAAHSAAGVGRAALGELEAAEEHRRQALALAIAAKMPDRAAGYMADLAGVQMARGKLVEAVQAAEQAARLSLNVRRRARLVQAECLRVWGRWEEAMDSLRQAKDGTEFPVAHLERRSQAIVDLGMAWIEADAGHPEAAMKHLRAAREALADDAKLRLWCDATEARLLAEQGKAGTARERMQDVAPRLADFAGDRPTLAVGYGQLGLAALDLGDDGTAEKYWNAYLALPPDPVWRPRGLFYLGEVLWRRGDETAARDAWQKAVDTGLDTHHTRRAVRRLGQT